MTLDARESGRIPDAVFARELDALIRRGVLKGWRRNPSRTGYRSFSLTFPDGQVMTGSTSKVYGVILGAHYAGARNGGGR